MHLELLELIRRLMAGYNLQVTVARPPFVGIERFDYGLRRALDPEFDWEQFGYTLMEQVDREELVFTRDVFSLRFAMFRLPDEESNLCIIGPWRDAKGIQESQRLQRMIGAQGMTVVRQFYDGVPSAQDACLIPCLRTISDMAWQGDLRVDERREVIPLHFQPDRVYVVEPEFQREIPAHMLERRYQMEGRMLESVRMGDVDGALRAWRQMQNFHIEGRFYSNLYQIKNLVTVMNTLLRKTIEQSKVHPYYIDRISSRYARRVEQMCSEDTDELLEDMLRNYCAYVQKYSLRDYSPMVQRVMNHINLNLDTSLSLKLLADLCYISPSYLSNLFKKETGTTLIDYINTQRVQRAAHLFRTSKYSVSTVAEKVGIFDVNYFAKLFKKAMGQTPTQYRRSHQQAET